jgi:hypothetical protein
MFKRNRNQQPDLIETFWGAGSLSLYAHHPVLVNWQGEPAVKADVYDPAKRRWVLVIMASKVIYQPADGGVYQTMFALPNCSSWVLAEGVASDILSGTEETVSRSVLDGDWGARA